MGYSIKLNDVFELSGNDYITIDKTEYNGFTYFFTNKLNGLLISLLFLRMLVLAL